MSIKKLDGNNTTDKKYKIIKKGEIFTHKNETMLLCTRAPDRVHSG